MSDETIDGTAALFPDRRVAGRVLARQLGDYADRDDVIVLGLPRGGIPVAYEVARALSAPLDVFVVRKLGAPGHEELALGAIASGGVRFLNKSLVGELKIPSATLKYIEQTELKELERREKLYRQELPPSELRDRTVIVVDDGLATGASMKAAIKSISRLGPAKIVVAVPVAAARTCDEIRGGDDGVPCICVVTPEPFLGVGMWYDDFGQTSDEEVGKLLQRRQEELRLARNK